MNVCVKNVLTVIVGCILFLWFTQTTKIRFIHLLINSSALMYLSAYPGFHPEGRVRDLIIMTKMQQQLTYSTLLPNWLAKKKNPIS